MALLGILAGLAIETRLNDGAALLMASGIVIACLIRKRRLISLICLGATAALTVVVVVWFTGDSFRQYWTNSVIRAGGPKGGTENILLFPLKMPWPLCCCFATIIGVLPWLCFS